MRSNDPITNASFRHKRKGFAEIKACWQPMTQHGRPACADITMLSEVLDQKLEPIRRAVMEHATNTVSASGVCGYAGKPSCLCRHG